MLRMRNRNRIGMEGVYSHWYWYPLNRGYKLRTNTYKQEKYKSIKY